MKTIRRIQNVAVIAALVMAASLADGMEITVKESLSAITLLVLAIALLLGRLWEQGREVEQ